MSRRSDYEKAWAKSLFVSLRQAAEDLNDNKFEGAVIEDSSELIEIFVRTYRMAAHELFKQCAKACVYPRLCVLTAVSRARTCNHSIMKIEFWEDIGIIHALVEALEEIYGEAEVKN